MKEYWLDAQNRSLMGQYLTSVEASFIDKCLQKETNIHSILDVGGGTGRFAIPLEGKGFKVTLIEVQSSPLWWLKTRSPSISGILISSQIRVWPIKDSSIDFVLAIQIPPVRTDWFWQECHRVLRSGGFVIICFSNSHSYKGLLYKTRLLLKAFFLKRGKRAYGNYYLLSAKDLIKTIEDNKFQLELALGYNWLPLTRDSNFFLIPFWGILEKKLGLGRNFTFQSPWVLFQARAG
jgi:ubiquinone/menaquinone biosynthesis C-methylase UbiE